MDAIRLLIKNWLGFNEDFPNGLKRMIFRFLANLDIGRHIRYREIVRIIKKAKMRERPFYNRDWIRKNRNNLILETKSDRCRSNI